ncbi:MAG: amino acid adenylation domain-containing protein [Acidobacteriota bacterium]|nr:amino acid adenylation domain-containing protein [Acidobacteriota bacterium]
MNPEDIADLYELSPMQQGMLFHSLQLAERGVYLLQLVASLEGPLDPGAFAAAWRRVLAAHGVLRTTFHWRELDKPLQVVHHEAPLELHTEDWQELDEAAFQERLATFLAEDRRRGFDLTELPLMRLTLIRRGPAEHQLVWTLHHLLLDGWCLSLVLEDFVRAYGAALAGAEAELPSRRPFGDYIEWLQQREPEADEAFWRRTLAGIAAPTPLGVDGLGMGEASSEIGAETESLDFEAGYVEARRRLSREASGALRSFAGSRGLTMNTLLQGAWGRLLSLYSGEERTVHGAVVSGRAVPLAGIGTMVGLFVNTLPVVVRSEPSMAVAAWLNRLQEGLGEMQEHEHSSLLDIQGWSSVPRGLPLFESVVAFENYPRSVAAGPGESAGGAASLSLTGLEAVERTNFPLSLLVAPGDELSLALTGDAQRFSQDTAEAILEHLEVLLVSLPERADGALADWRPLSDTERRRVLEDGRGEVRDFSPWTPLHRLFEASVDRDPEAPGVIFEDLQLSYGEVDRRANRLARLLVRRGVGPDVLVGLSLGRSERLPVAMLAVLKAGGAFLPLDPTLPAERLRTMLEDAEPRVVITEERWLGGLPESAAQRLVLDGEEASRELAEESAARLEDSLLSEDLSPDNRAYVIFTSGSTGRPKGVEISHRGLHNLAEAQVLVFGLGAADRVLQFASLNFDASVFEMTMALRAGAALYMASPEDLLPGQPLTRTLGRHRITSLTVTPSALVAVDPKEVPELAMVVAAGEACSPDLAAAWAADRRFFNAYGPTEATVWGTVERCAGGGARPTIGGPIANAVVRVVDPRGRLQPPRVAGELCLGGPGLARGYLRRPALTAERFVPDPWSEEPGARLYRTGDLVRWLPSGDLGAGRLDFLGRIDFQVKLRGFRIELEEIAETLRRHPQVEQAAVLHRNDPGGPRLVAYVVPAGGPKEDEAPRIEAWRHFLQERLPEYMIPSVFLSLERLPLTSSGKLDRGALPVPESTRAALEQPFVAPRNEIERTVAEIWRSVLGLDSVGVDDNFFDLGGHSLHLFQVHKKLEEALERNIVMTDLFRYPSVAQLARALSAPASAEPVEDAGRERIEAAGSRRRRQERRQKERRQKVGKD